KKPYSRVLIPAENGNFFAEILEFPGCYAEGATPTEAFNNLEKAARAWILEAERSGQKIPEPSTSPGYSGKVVLRLPKSLHRKASQYAERDRSSLNQFFTTAIAAQVGAEEFARQLTDTFARRMIRITGALYSTPTSNAKELRTTVDVKFTRIPQNRMI